jgi:capsular polysaccharide biosynthesis protein
MNLLFSPPSLEDFSCLLKAWRFWLLAALIGALIGAAIYYVAPPPYRARATVLVDFNLEQAWPKDTDRQQFYYLERESRKLEEIAWSDSVLQVVAVNYDLNVSELRNEKLILSQPAEAGWHFYAEDQDRSIAAAIASAWAQAFADQARAKIGKSDSLNSFIQIDVTQSADLPVKRSVSISTYLLTSVLTFMTLAAFCVLFFHKNK